MDIDKKNLDYYYTIVKEKDKQYQIDRSKRNIRELKRDINILRKIFRERIIKYQKSNNKDRYPKILVIGNREGHISYYLTFLKYDLCLGNKKITIKPQIYALTASKNAVKKNFESDDVILHEFDFLPDELANIYTNVKKFSNKKFDLIIIHDYLHSFRELHIKNVSANIINWLHPKGLLLITWKHTDHSLFGKGAQIDENTFDLRLFRPVRYVKDYLSISNMFEEFVIADEFKDLFKPLHLTPKNYQDDPKYFPVVQPIILKKPSDDRK